MRRVRRLALWAIAGTVALGGFGMDAGTPAGCVTVSSGNWYNIPFGALQTGTAFTAELDVTPLSSTVDVVLGATKERGNDFSLLVANARLNSSGYIDARSGSGYITSSFRYAANTTYHIRMTIDLAHQTYNVYATAPGAAEQTIGSNLAFRFWDVSLSTWTLSSDSGSATVCGLAAPSVHSTPNAVWSTAPFLAQSGQMTYEWDGTPSALGLDTVMAISNGAQAAFPAYSCLVRFSSQSGYIDVRNGSTYMYDSGIKYAAGTTYHFRLQANPGLNQYSVWVTPAGSSEIRIAANYSFRDSASNVSQLNSFGVITDAGTGYTIVGNFRATGFQDTFAQNSGLITNEYAYYNGVGSASPIWSVTSGSFFWQNGTGWSGVPDGCAADEYSATCTDSNVFRVNTKSDIEGAYTVTFALMNNGTGGANPWDGVHVFMRHLSQYDLYYASVNRYDQYAYIKRKVPCGGDNQGTYFVLGSMPMGWSVGLWQHFSVSIVTNSDQSVTITLTNTDTKATLQATDHGGTNSAWSSSCTTPGHYPTSSYPPISSGGYTGIRADYANFNVDNFTVALQR